MTVGERIKQIRKENKMTQIEFAKAISISNVSVSQLEADKFNMARTTERLICTMFHINPEWLRTGEGEMHSIAETAEELVPELVNTLNDNPALLHALKRASVAFSAEDWKKLNDFVQSLGGES